MNCTSYSAPVDVDVCAVQVVPPFVVTRTVWVLIAYYAYGNYVANPSYEKYYKQGYFLTRYFLLDIFARWDARCWAHGRPWRERG